MDGGDCNIPDAFLKKRGDNNNNNNNNADSLARTSENLNFTDSSKSQPLSFFEFDHLNVFML